MIINLSEGKANYSQRNNKVRPMATCNTTSMIMGLIYSGIKLPIIPNGIQPEDALTKFLLEDQRVDDYYKKMHLAEYQKYISSGKNPNKSYPPNELHVVLAYGTNLWVGQQVVTFSFNATINQILFSLVKGKAVVQSGFWSGLNHITCIVGFETDQENIKEVKTPNDIDLSKVKNIIMDDPFGDYKTGYKVQLGNDIIVPYKDYMSFTKPLGLLNKWAHFISNPNS